MSARKRISRNRLVSKQIFHCAIIVYAYSHKINPVNAIALLCTTYAYITLLLLSGSVIRIMDIVIVIDCTNVISFLQNALLTINVIRLKYTLTIHFLVHKIFQDLN